MTRPRAVVLTLALVLGVPAASAASDAVPPSEDYLLHCAGCHGVDGRGNAITPDLHALAPLLDAPGGRAYLARIPGVAQAPVDDARLARLLDWVLSKLSGRTPIPAFDAAEVGDWRSAPLRDPFAARPIPR